MLALLLWIAVRDPLGAAFERDLAARARANCGREFRIAAGAVAPVALVRSLTGGEDGKELYVQFLKDRHGYAIARVNELYGTDVASFTELVTNSFRHTDPQRREVAEDDTAFLETMKSHWSAVVAKECREKHRLHLDAADLVVVFER